MKKILFLLLFFSAHVLFGQKADYQSPKFNSFLANSIKLKEFQDLSDTIYSGGKIIFDYQEVNSFKSLEDYIPLFDLGSDVTFEVVSEKQSRFDEDKIYTRYQQFYKGVIVEGGGVTVGYIHTGGNTTTGGPCDRIQMLSPYFFSGIDISVDPTIIKKDVQELLDVTNMKAELVITTNIRNDFEYLLAWKVNDGRRITWVDANNGDILKSIDAMMNKNAPTEDYGVQDISDRIDGSVTLLETDDLDNNPNVGRFVRTYDFGGASVFGHVPTDYDINLMPTSPLNVEWSENDAPSNVFQAHYIATMVSNFFSQELEINFNILHIAANCTGLNAGALSASSLVEGWVAIGESKGSTLAEVDIMGHELAHVYLNGFLDYTEGGNASLHEGLADMYGTYMEYLFQEKTDWEMGDDVPFIVRDLENPAFTCYSDVEDFAFGQRHVRSTPLGHWFYLIAHGNSGHGIGPLGIERAINIVDESLVLLGRNSDYQELLEATIAVVSENFGICSKEFNSITEAWAEICLGDKLDVRCPGELRGNYSVCEENNYLNVYVNGSGTFPDFIWSLSGRDALYYKNCCYPQTGNHVYGGNSLTIIDFPKHPFYPQYLRIEATPFGYFPNIKLTFKVKIQDCDGDDPTCEEYYGRETYRTTSQTIIPDMEESKFLPLYLDDLLDEKVVIFDLLGRIIYNGNFDDFHLDPNQSNGNFFFVFNQRTGEVVKYATHFFYNK